MVIIALADIHGYVDNLEKICGDIAPADLVLIAGDITQFGGWKEAREIISEIRRYADRVLAVPGNCDKEGVGEYLSSEGMNLDCNCIEIDGVTFAGLGGSLPCPGATPNESPEETFVSRLKELQEKTYSKNPLVMVTHQPAYGAKIDMANDRHTGSMAITDFIKTNKPILALSGHIHEAIGVDTIDSTTVVNPGPFRRGMYAYIKLSDTVEQVAIRGSDEDLSW